MIGSMLQELVKDKPLHALMQSFSRTVRPANKDVLTGVVKAQASTHQRNMITVAQQYRWHLTVEEGLEFLRKRNVGRTPDGKSFGEVAHHFIVGGDETCLQASNSEVRVIGDKQKTMRFR